MLEAISIVLILKNVWVLVFEAFSVRPLCPVIGLFELVMKSVTACLRASRVWTLFQLSSKVLFFRII